jgi:hypothetical protein
MDILHLILPLFFLIPSYKSLLLAFDGHSSTNLCSPGGDFTLTQPVVRAKSLPRCSSRAFFQSSRSPLYLLDYISFAVSLCIYSQYERSASKLTFFDRTFDDYHFSVVGLGCVGGSVEVVGSNFSVYFTLMDYVLSVGAIFIFCRTSCYTYFWPTGGLRATYRSKISSSVSFPSSIFTYSIGSNAGVSTIVGGGAAGFGAICLCMPGNAVAAICSYLTVRAHLDSPSMSSTSLRRFLCLSTVLASSWSDGERSAPFMLSWCLSPRPAWSCFSTAAIFSIIPAVVCGDCAFDACCVDGSFNCSTIVSRSSIRAR